MNITPKPWDARIVDTINDRPALWEIQDRHRGVIATVESVNAADAHLIAAAPDLLAALCDLLDEADLNEVDEYTAPKIEAARAAIARATCDQTMPA
jgi:hypothetical protein